jgi:DNA-binding CsgD family transcriptional regulator
MLLCVMKWVFGPRRVYASLLTLIACGDACVTFLMRSQSFTDLSQAGDVDTFKRRLISVAYALEFDLVNSAYVRETPGQKPLIRMVGNTPQAFLDSAKSATEGARDPVLKRLKSESIPFLYDQTTYTEAGAGDLWEEQARHGYATGISVALHLPGDSHFFIGLDRDRQLPSDDAHLTRLLADLQLLAVHAQHAASRLLAPVVGSGTGAVPHLSDRELEVLRYAKDGKSSATIGLLIGLTERGVIYHVENAKSKLNCATRMQAVLRAIDLGLL